MQVSTRKIVIYTLAAPLVLVALFVMWPIGVVQLLDDDSMDGIVVALAMAVAELLWAGVIAWLYILTLR